MTPAALIRRMYHSNPAIRAHPHTLTAFNYGGLTYHLSRAMLGESVVWLVSAENHQSLPTVHMTADDVEGSFQ